jgi:hypothetical protein
MVFNKLIKVTAIVAVCPFFSNATESTSLLDEITNTAPEYYQLFNKKTTFLDQTILTQEALFDMDGISYDRVDLSMKKYSQQYSIIDMQASIDNKYVLTNKVRLLAGIPPISKLDNKQILLCKVESGMLIEVAEIQIMQILNELNSSINYKSICTKNGGAKAYWSQRYHDFYNEFGGLR